MKNNALNAKNNELFTELRKYPANTKEYRELVAAIVKNNLGLVTYVAKKYFPILPGSKLINDDLIEEGYYGLLKAVKSFDLAKGEFPTYARTVIEHEIWGRFKREQKHKNVSSLNDNLAAESEDKPQSAEILLSPINVEEDIVLQDEKRYQMAWLRKNLDRLTPTQKQVLTAKYLSGAVKLTDVALAKRFNCSKQNISLADNTAIAKLKAIYDAEINLTPAAKAEKVKAKETLKNLILTQLSPNQRKTMLCKFYATTPKTNAQVAQEVNLTQRSVESHISTSYSKLCTLCDDVQDTKHLKSILAYKSEASEKER